MSLRKTTLLLLGAIAAVSIAFVALASKHVVKKGYGELEQEFMRLSVERVMNALDYESARIMGQLKDWAFWDDARDFVTGDEAGFESANLMDDTFTNLQINVMLFFSADGRMVYVKGYDPANERPLPLSQDFLAMFAPDSPWVRFTDPQEERSGLAWTDKGMIMLCAAPILDSEGKGPVSGAMVMGRFMDQSFVEDLARITLLDVQFEPLSDLVSDGWQDQEVEAWKQAGGVAVRVVGDDRINGYALLPGQDREPALALKVSRAREVMSRGRGVQNLVMVAVAGGFVFMVLGLYLVLDRRVLSRVGALAAQVLDISGREELSRRVDVPGRDEIAGLAKAINVMLAALEQADADLAENKERLDLVLDATNDGVWDWDVPSDSMYTSPQFYAMLGYGPGELPMTWDAIRSLVHPDDVQMLNDTVAEGLRECSYKEIILRMRAKDGTWLWVLSQGRTVEVDEQGRAKRVVGTHKNITERKRIEEALLESETRYRSVMEHSPMGMHIYELHGDELVVSEANPSSLQIVRTTAEQIIGKPLEEAFPRLKGTIYPQRYKELALGGEPWTFEFVIERDGVLRIALMITAFHLSPGRMVVFFIDTMKQHLAEVELRKSEEKFSTLFRMSPDSIIVIDAETGTIDDANDAFMQLTGYSREEALGKTTTQLGLYDDPRKREEILAQLKNSGRIDNMEVTFKSRHGTLGFFAISGTMATISGRAYIVTIARDITAIKKMQEVMVQSEKMLSVGGIAAGIAHEINNPLGIVLQAAQNLELRTRPDFPKNVEVAESVGLDLGLMAEYMRARKLDVFLQDINGAAKRASIIIRHMLDFSRRSESRRTVCGIRGIIEGAVSLAGSDFDLRKSYDFKKINLNVSMDEDLPLIHCTETEIEQVVLNLLRNSAQALAGADPPIAEPRIDIRVSKLDGWVRVEVEDNGPGIPQDIQKRIMEPFFTTKEPGIGTGLGLSVSYFIVTSGHGGKFTVSSQPGQGACFTMDLPVEEARSGAQ